MLKNACTLATTLVTGWLLLLASHCNGATESAGRYCVDVWSTREGFPQSSVITMIQTHDGYLWLGTLNGLVRFDGLHFTVYDESNTQGLNSSQIVKLFEDSRENLWVGTETAGAALIRNGQVIALGIGRGSRDGRLVTVCEDTNGAVWLATADGRMFRHLNGEVRECNVRCRALISEISGQLWRANDRGGLFAVDLQTGADKTPTPVAQFGRLDYLLASKSGGQWRIADGAIQKWANGQMTQSLGAYPWPASVKVSSACEDWGGNLVVGTLGAGLYWFDAQGKATCLSTNDGLSSNYILSMRADDSRSLWVGTDGRGLNRVRIRLFKTLEASSGLTVRSVCEDDRGRLWFTSDGLGVACLAEGVISTNNSVYGRMQNHNVRAILTDFRQKIWVSTFGLGVFVLQNDLFVPSGAGAIPSEVTAIMQDRAGRLWAGTQGGLALWDDRAWKLFTTNDGLSANIVRAIADDGHGSLWIGTELGGLNRLRDGHFSSYQQTNGFPSDNISALYADADGVVWVGTFGCGLIRAQNGVWKLCTTRDGLVSNGINYLIEDNLGCLWIGSNRGLMRIRKKALNDFASGVSDFVPCAVYGERDGLPASECTPGTQPAACRTRDGKLWFPTIGGLACADPSEFGFNTNPPPVRIEAVRVEGRHEATDTVRAQFIEPITIPAGRERLEIQYAGISLTAPSALRFKYWLERHEASWSPAGDSRVANYTKLPPGKYTFHVTACNEDGVWNQAGASLAITVLPPFWSTGWFRSVAVASLLGIISAMVYFISTQRLHRQLEGMRQQQALEKERARIARDIHDQVGASLTQVSLLGEMVESDKDYSDEIQAHAKQISQTARETARALDEIVWTVNPSNDTLDGLVNYICKNAQDYLAVAGLRYRLEMPAQLPAAAISPEARHNVFLAAKEAVTNVVRHARASEVWIRLKIEPDRFILEIEDNGCGPAGLDAVAKKSRNGLRNMRKRMEDIGGEFTIGPGAQGGTLACLAAPLNINPQ